MGQVLLNKVIYSENCEQTAAVRAEWAEGFGSLTEAVGL